MKTITYILIFLSCFVNYTQAQNCPPIAACRASLAVDLQPGGTFTMYPEDIREGMVPDSCLPVLTFEIEITDMNQNVVHPKADSIELACADVGSDLLAVLHVSNGTDTNLCWGELTVRDDGGHCESFGNDTIPVRFNIFNRWRIPANSLNVKLNGNPIQEYKDGLFIIERDDILTGENTIEWEEVNAQSFGEFSTLDAIMGFRMFFDLSYNNMRALALDLDQSFSMSLDDVIYIRQYILGQRPILSDRTFVTLPNDYTFSPDFDRYDFGFDSYVWTFDGDTVDQVNFSYNVWSMGDLDNIDSLTTGGTEPRNTDLGILSFEDQWLEAGKTYEIPIQLSMKSGSGIHGFQFAFDLDNWTNFDISHNYSGSSWMNHIIKNEYRVSFAQLEIEQDINFYITINPVKSGYLSELMTVSKEFKSEVVPEAITGYDIQLRSTKRNPGEFKALPNPFTNEIAVVLPEGIPSTITLYDLSGKQINTWNVEGERIRLSTEEVNPGIYLLQIRNDQKTASFKMVKQ